MVSEVCLASQTPRNIHRYCKVVSDEYIFERSGLFLLSVSSIMLARVQVSLVPQQIPSSRSIEDAKTSSSLDGEALSNFKIVDSCSQNNYEHNTVGVNKFSGILVVIYW